MLLPNRHFSLSAKMNGTQRRTLVSPRRMQCNAKGMCPAKATLNNEKTKSIALAVTELRLSEGISQSVRQSVSRKFCVIFFFLNSIATC